MLDDLILILQCLMESKKLIVPSSHDPTGCIISVKSKLLYLNNVQCKLS